jgi:hypothetical protein
MAISSNLNNEEIATAPSFDFVALRSGRFLAMTLKEIL